MVISSNLTFWKSLIMLLLYKTLKNFKSDINISFILVWVLFLILSSSFISLSSILGRYHIRNNIFDSIDIFFLYFYHLFLHLDIVFYHHHQLQQHCFYSIFERYHIVNEHSKKFWQHFFINIIQHFLFLHLLPSTLTFISN